MASTGRHELRHYGSAIRDQDMVASLDSADNLAQAILELSDTDRLHTINVATRSHFVNSGYAEMQNWFDVTAEMEKEGNMIASEALQPTPTATTVRASEGAGTAGANRARAKRSTLEAVCGTTWGLGR